MIHAQQHQLEFFAPTTEEKKNMFYLHGYQNDRETESLTSFITTFFCWRPFVEKARALCARRIAML